MCVTQSIPLDSYVKGVSSDIILITYISCIVELVNGQTQPRKSYLALYMDGVSNLKTETDLTQAGILGWILVRGAVSENEHT